jgi:hypothetical protein
MDFAEGTQSAFDVKEWINQQFQTEDVDSRAVHNLALKLQSQHADLTDGMEQASKQLFQALPKTTKEIGFIQKEASLLRETLVDIVKDVSEIDRQNHASVHFLAEIDQVKHRVGKVSLTLTEVDNWKQRTREMEQVFETRDLPRIADQVGQLQESLQVLASLPDHEPRSEELRGFRARLETMATPHLLEAVGARDEAKLVSLGETFTKLGRSEAVKRHYLEAQVADLQKILARFVGRAADASWLPGALDEITSIMRKEAQWAPRVFTSQDPPLMAELQTVIARTLEPAMKAWLAALASTNPKDLPRLVEVHGLVQAFLQQQQGFSDASSWTHIIRSTMGPFVFYQLKYEVSEGQALQQTLDGFMLTDADHDETVNTIRHVIVEVFTTARAALDRCVRWTGSVQTLAVVRAVNSFLAKYLARLSKLATARRSFAAIQSSASSKGVVEVKAGPAAPEDGDDSGGEKGFFDDSDDEAAGNAASDTDWSGFQNAFHLLRVCSSIKGELLSLETDTAEKLASPVRNLLAVSKNPEGNDSLLWLSQRLLLESSPPATTLGLEAFIEHVLDEHYKEPWRDLEALLQEIRDLIYDYMFQVIRLKLDSFESWPIWHEQSKSSLLKLPVFSLQPSEYMTQVGEHLLTLVQQLELSANKSDPEGEDAGESGSSDDTEPVALDGEDTSFWLDLISHGVCDELVNRVQTVERFTEKGGKQLACDVDYLANVLSALGLSITPLATAIAAASGASSQAQVQELLRDGTLQWSSAKEKNALKTVIEARGFSFNPEKEVEDE